MRKPDAVISTHCAVFACDLKFDACCATFRTSLEGLTTRDRAASFKVGHAEDPASAAFKVSVPRYEAGASNSASARVGLASPMDCIEQCQAEEPAVSNTAIEQASSGERAHTLSAPKDLCGTGSPSHTCRWAAAVEVMQGDLASCLIHRMRGCVDLLVFNPPYVPSPEDEVGGDRAAAAWAGGMRGRRVIDRFMPIMAELLSPTGRAYMVLVRENKVGEVARAGMKLGLTCDRVAGTRAMNERLMVVVFQKNHSQDCDKRASEPGTATEASPGSSSSGLAADAAPAAAGGGGVGE